MHAPFILSLALKKKKKAVEKEESVTEVTGTGTVFLFYSCPAVSMNERTLPAEIHGDISKQLIARGLRNKII